MSIDRPTCAQLNSHSRYALRSFVLQAVSTFANAAIYPLGDTNTVPQEFYVRPAEVWLPLWPERGAMSVNNTDYLREVYDAALNPAEVREVYQ